MSIYGTGFALRNLARGGPMHAAVLDRRGPAPLASATRGARTSAGSMGVLWSMLGYPTEPLEPLDTSAVPKQDKATVTIQYCGG